VVPPAQLRGKAMAVVGAPGAGKTVTLLRLAYLAARGGSQGVVCRLLGHRPPPSCRP
jgi:KaiC/GvpD/RAD55 family RecA-like ATPase